MSEIPWFGWLGIGAAVMSVVWLYLLSVVLDRRDRAEWRTRHHAHPHDLKAYHNGGSGG